MCKKLSNEILLFKVPKDEDLRTSLRVCYKDINGVFNKIGIITDVYIDGFTKNYLINTSFGSYVASELRLFKKI